MKKRILGSVMLLCFACLQIAAKSYELTSPNGEIMVNVHIDEHITYDISYLSTPLFEKNRLQMTLATTQLGLNPKLRSAKRTTVDETFVKEISFKNSSIRDHYNQLALRFSGDYGVDFRVYDDGLAYRFVTSFKGESIVMDELFEIHPVGDASAVLQMPSRFKTSYENRYEKMEVKQWMPDGKMANLPSLFTLAHPYKVLVTEADLADYPCMFLRGDGTGGVISLFPKVPTEFGNDGDRSVKILKEADYIAKTAGTRSYPWRTLIITKNDGQFVECDMVSKLSPRNKIGDLSWIKPGLVSWEWWHDAALYGVDFEAGYNLDSYKYYIDFAANFGIPYIIMDEGWAKSTTDPYTPNSKVDVHELIRYGKTKNVGVVLWLTWLTVEKNMDLFKTFNEWGVKGVKIDFMDRSDQWMVNYYERVAREAAKYKIMVSFHGSFKPAGLECAYPNVVTYEGVLGLEQGGNCKVDNSLYLPFMRGVCGPMDFTPGAMLNAQPEHLGYTRIRPVGSGTRCFQLSTFVIFETGFQMLADNPVNYYRERECTEFLSSVPVVWDETKALYAEAGKVLVLAKRKGDKWFIGGMSNNDQRERIVEVPLHFLTEGAEYKITAFEDGVNAARQGMDYRKREFDVKGGSVLKIRMVRNGGYAASVEKK